MNLLAAGARCCAGAIFFAVAMAATQPSPTPGTSAPARKAGHRSNRHGAEAILCKRCSNDNGASATPPSPTPTATPSVAAPQKPDLNSCVIILEANQKNEISRTLPLGAALQLTLFVKEPPALHPQGELRSTTFTSQGEQPSVSAPTKLAIEANTGTSNSPALVDLSKAGARPFALRLERLRPGKTYKGQLVLTADELINQWTVTLTTERGVIAVDPVGTLKFVRSPRSGPYKFSFTLRDKSESGPYHNVWVRFEPAAATNSKALTSNFNLGNFSFWKKRKRVDMEQRGTNPARNAVTLTTAHTFTAQFSSLSPGEYSGTLHFAADETSDETAEAKLPMTIQVRDCWIFPVVVIVVGSLLGWFTSKFITGARRARDLSQQINALRLRLDTLARKPSLTPDWEFPSEAISLGFARVDVELSLLARMAKSTTEVIFQGDRIENRKILAEQRLSGLESLRETRLAVEPSATDRPTAQWAIGNRLRSATDLLDAPTFGANEQTRLKEQLDGLRPWQKEQDDAFVTVYQQALLERLRSNERPELGELNEGTLVGTQLKEHIEKLPKSEEISKQKNRDDLKGIDKMIARVALLWRESEMDWANKLAEKDKTLTLNGLFDYVDLETWNKLVADKEKLLLAISRQNPKSYDIVEINLRSDIERFDVVRLRSHPLYVGWRIEPPQGKIRTEETDGFTLVQYFPSPGTVTVRADLHWESKTLSVPKARNFTIDRNPEYGSRWRWFIRNWVELVAIGIALLFAIATEMATQYDATFGTFTQYLAIFVWAAGAGTGGNLLTQLGQSSSAK